jgi:hypothetical protein
MRKRDASIAPMDQTVAVELYFLSTILSGLDSL